MDAVNFTITDLVLNLDFVNLRKLGGGEGAGRGGGGGYANIITQRVHNPSWQDVMKHF